MYCDIKKNRPEREKQTLMMRDNFPEKVVKA